MTPQAIGNFLACDLLEVLLTYTKTA